MLLERQFCLFVSFRVIGNGFVSVDAVDLIVDLTHVQVVVCLQKLVEFTSVSDGEVLEVSGPHAALMIPHDVGAVKLVEKRAW